MSETKEVDSFRYIDGLTRRIVKGWIEREPPISDIPWTELQKPLEDCTVALISSAGVCLNEDQPFDQEGERENPWWGDPSYRVIPKTATEQDIKVCHLHIDPRFAEEDLNCVLPLERLNGLEGAKKIGRSAANHYSFMGYILKPDVLLSESAPAMIQGLQADEVDAVVLLPVWPFCCRSVGLVQREIEAAGIPTISLSPIMAFTASVGAPRIAAIEHPLGRLLGKPGDAAGQMAILEATLQALITINEPGGVVYLPFEWPETPRQARSHPEEPPPISKYLRKHPWMLRKFMVKEIPD